MFFTTTIYAILCYNMIYCYKGRMESMRLSFSEQVKYVLMNLQISQTELAELLGVSYATVSRWERENRKPQMALLSKFYSFCKRNDINFSEFM